MGDVDDEFMMGLHGFYMDLLDVEVVFVPVLICFFHGFICFHVLLMLWVWGYMYNI